MPELPHRNLDTGMGLERMAAIMQHKTANYDGDLMQHLIKLGEKISGKTYDADDYSGASRSLRIIADHSRAVDFMISDGILPGNEGREYVLRRLLRRAVFHGRLLGIEGAFLTKFIDEVNAQMGEAIPSCSRTSHSSRVSSPLRRSASPRRSTTAASTWTRPWLLLPRAPCFRARSPLSCTIPLVSPST